tara:strand:+ start:3563 stop:3766 length:204 start_codon:yes stop_codon:yes gene_type:complete
MHHGNIEVFDKGKGLTYINPFISFPLTCYASGQALMKRNEPKKNLAKRNLLKQGPTPPRSFGMATAP